MRKQALGNDEVSVIGMGTAEFGGRHPEGLARDLLDAYVSLGGNLVDTARVYGDFATPRNGESEKIVGRWMEDRGNRREIFLSTKGGHPPFHDMHRSRLSPEEIRGDMAASLEDLRTGYVDIYFLHRDDPSRPVGGIMETLHGLVEDGYTRMIGVSNWAPARIREANDYAEAHGLTRLSVNQPQFSLAQQRFFLDPTTRGMDAETWRMHRETGMACFCFSSQAHGYFTRLDTRGDGTLTDNLRREFDCPENRAVLERIRAVSGETGLSVGSIALAWLTGQPFPTFPLVGASKVEHVLALREAGDAVLTDAQRDLLRTVV
ncbi:MAG: aldo/keto reductase [Clostridia bacterium]|nr:aldo/keto reductase [Clostridia bacterium]